MFNWRACVPNWHRYGIQAQELLDFLAPEFPADFAAREYAHSEYRFCAFLQQTEELHMITRDEYNFYRHSLHEVMNYATGPTMELRHH